MRRAASLGLLLLIAACSALLASGRLYIVRSSSMSPVFRAGDAIVIWPVRDLPDVGDVISYEVQGELITHRVVEVQPDGVLTKGDANQERDGWVVGSAQIRGRMIARVPFLGWLLVFLRQPAGWLLFVIAPALGVIALEIRRIRDARRTPQRGEASEWST